MYRKVILFAFAAFLLSVKADGRFPLPDSLSETLFQLFLLPYSVLFLLAIFLFFQGDSSIISAKRLSAIQLTSWICIFFEFMILAILFWQEKKYAQFGYDLNHSFVMVSGFISLFLFVPVLRSGSHRQFVFAASFAFIVTYALSILSFPLHPARSDMLPLIQAAGERFLSVGNPYTMYTLPHQLPLTYLPGMWMAYLPAVLFRFDLRVLHVAAVISSVLIVYAATPSKQKENTALFCGLFLMIPYLHYRHEIYIGILWLSLSIMFFFHTKNKPILACVCLGISASISQFSWVLSPVLLLSIQKQYGWKVAAWGFGCCAAVACSILLPFWIQSPDAFYRGVFGHWEEGFNATTVNFSYFASKILSLNSLKYVQILLLAATYFIARKNNHLPQRTYEFMTYALLFFLLFNPLIWVYFYLTLFQLMLFHIGYLSASTHSEYPVDNRAKGTVG
jgi:hypothetical protein